MVYTVPRQNLTYHKKVVCKGLTLYKRNTLNADTQNIPNYGCT